MLIRRLALAPLLLAALVHPLVAQSETDLKRYFEGRRVTIRIDMPGTEQGVDIYPGTERPLDYPRYAGRLKEHGTAIEAGDDAMITKIRVKSGHIEFQLDGGGYGTMGDETSSSVHVESAPRTTREKNLEAELKREDDPVRRGRLKEELDDLKAAREREDASNRAQVAAAEEQKEQNIRQRRLSGGSRFNLRYRGGLPPAVLTPEGLQSALAEYVAFADLPSRTGDRPAGAEPPAEQSTPGARFPRKGLTAAEVEEMLGPSIQTAERPEGTLRVVTRTYRFNEGRLSAEFVEDVLFRYSVTSD